MHLPKLPILAGAGVLLAAATAWAAPARTIDLSAAETKTWDGSGVTGTPVVDVTVDDTQLKLAVGGSITVSTSEPGPTGEEDIDIYVYKADAAGEPQGDPIAEGVEGGDENVSVKNLAAGSYVVRAFAFVGVDATYKGSVKFAPSAAAAPTTPGAPAPAAPAAPAADALPDAAITKPKSGKARSFKGLSGTASDDKGVAAVEVAIVRKKGKKCTQLKGKKFVKLSKCTAPTAYNKAKGTTRWSYKAKLKKGSYTAYARAVDSAGQRQGGFTPKNKKAFKLK